MEQTVFIPTREEFEKILEDKVDEILTKRIPQIIRQANRKEWLTTGEFKELFGVSFRLQKYYRDELGLPYSQEGKKIYFKTTDVEQFMEDRKVNGDG